MGELKYEEIFNAIGYHFKDPSLIDLAFTHSSYSTEINNERLEFFGDAILAFILAEYLYSARDKYTEGKMTKILSQVACRKTQAMVIKDLGISHYMRMSHGESMDKGFNKQSVMAGLYEALLAAIYLDGGMKAAKAFVISTLEEYLIDSQAGRIITNFKSELQEKIQEFSTDPITYELVSEKGKNPNKIFTSAVYFEGKKQGIGRGTSKKKSEQMAAKDALHHLFKLSVEENASKKTGN